MESEIDLKVSFRFLSLNDEQVEKLRLSFGVIELGKHFKTGKNVGIVILRSDNIRQVSKFMDVHGIAPEDTDIFLSFITFHSTRILDIPGYVADAAVELKSRLTLSYTIKR